MRTIIFSKDRALQLDALLRSYADHVTPCTDVHVLYDTSSDAHRASYRDVFLRHAWVWPRRQTRFEADVRDMLAIDGCVVFLVDDQIFVRPWDVTEEVILSLRLGAHLTHCYPTNTAQPLPTFETLTGGLLCWRWKDGAGDWGYPLSLDGHVFDASEMLRMVERSTFTSPNTLEAALQRFSPLARHGFCYPESKVINVPWTRVQTDCDNRFAGLSTEDMLAFWQAGHRIAVSSFYGTRNVSAHQEFPLALEELETVRQ